MQDGKAPADYIPLDYVNPLNVGFGINSLSVATQIVARFDTWGRGQ
jgi:hypothetical protein